MMRIVQPVKHIHGSIKVPGDKSISHRALMLGALAQGTTTIYNLSTGKDVASTKACLSDLGIEIQSNANQTTVTGKGTQGLIAPDNILDAGNSGTTIRLLSGILAAQSFTSRITGDSSLRRRPMDRIMVPLRQMGAKIETSPGGVAPLTIHGRKLQGIEYTLPIASAQVKSCVLMAGLCASGTTRVIEPMQSRDHTERMLSNFGIDIRIHNQIVEITGPVRLSPCDIHVPGDPSSAAFFIVATSIVSNSELRIENIGMNPTRTGLMDVLKRAGGHIEEHNPRTLQGEPRADLLIRKGRLRGIEISGDCIPQIIDEIPILAVLATQAEGCTVVRDAKELRIKETDRIAAIAENLRAMGAHIEVLDDGFIIKGPQELKGADIRSHDDHRIAMAFSIAGLVADNETRILDSNCVDISFPGFYEILAKITHE